MIQQPQSYCKPLKQPQIESNIINRMHGSPFTRLFWNTLKLIHYVNFVADDAMPNALTIDIIKKFTKNDKLLHQVMKLVRQNNSYKLNKPLTFLE